MRNFKDRIRTFRRKPVYEILTTTKESKDSFFVCYRETLDGKRTCRNLDYLYMAGYRAYGKPEKSFVPFWAKKTPTISALEDYTASEEDIKPLLNVYPEFIYTFRKCGGISKASAFQIFRKWSKFPKLEILLNLGLFTLAMNENFLKFDMKRQKEIINFYLEHEESEEERHFVNLNNIKGAMENNCSYKEYANFVSDKRRHFLTKLDFPSYKKLVAKNIPLYDYMWYMNRLRSEFPERTKDTYWTTFKNVDDFFKKEHRINEQIENKIKLEATKERKKLSGKYKKTVNKFRKWDSTFNGLHIYIPQEIPDIENQANVLNQCLISCNYIKQVINKRCILAFIKKDDKPLATAEFDRETFKLGQFYGNELDRNNCLPPEGCKEALDKFITKYIKKSA